MKVDLERFVWGVNPVLEALRARADRVERVLMQDSGLAPRVANEIFARARDEKIRVEKVPRERLQQLTNNATHQGVVAEVRVMETIDLNGLLAAVKRSELPGLTVVLDGVQDVQNVGAIIRSAHAFGAQGVVVPKDRAAPITGAVAKASAGALEHCPVCRVTNVSRALDELKEAGFWTVAADPRGDRDLWDAPLTGPIAVVVGAEGPGVRQNVLEHCDFRVRIPMVGEVASLNASVSAAVLLAEVARQRAHEQKVKRSREVAPPPGARRSGSDDADAPEDGEEG